MKAKIKELYKKENIIFYLAFVAYIVIFWFTPTTNDDVVLRGRYVNLTLSDHWQLILHDYFEWSSRVLVNAVVHVILGWSIYVWVILNAVIMYIMMRALSTLFVTEEYKLEGNILVACSVSMYSFSHMGGAGWVTTTCTYLWPLAFGFVALIPIKNYMENKRSTWWQNLCFALALIYAANEELEMVTILLCYMVFGVIMFVRRTFTFPMVSMVILSIGSAIFTLTAPGNGTRSDQEIVSWFRDYRMLNTIDKVDLGLTSTLQEVLFGRYIFFMILTTISLVIIWKQYKSILLRLVALVPFGAVTVFGLTKDILGNLYSPFLTLARPVSNNGLITLENCTGKKIYFVLLVYIFIAFIFILSIYLVLGNSYKTILALALLFAGTGGRIVMGFSPTVWASGNRTFSTLMFALIAILIMAIMHGYEQKLFSKKEIKCLMVIMVLCAIGNLTYTFTLLIA